MGETVFALSRTLFLPKGSPPILNIEELKIEVRKQEIVAEGGQLFCKGDIDILLDYLSQDENFVSGGRSWQVLLSLPFEVQNEGYSACPPLCDLQIAELDWFVVAPRALELNLQLLLQSPKEDVPCPGQVQWQERQEKTLKEELTETMTDKSSEHDLWQTTDEQEFMKKSDVEVNVGANEELFEQQSWNEEIKDTEVFADSEQKTGDISAVSDVSLGEQVLVNEKNEKCVEELSQDVAEEVAVTNLEPVVSEVAAVQPVVSIPAVVAEETVALKHKGPFCMRFYRVKPGEEGITIALRFGVSPEALAAKNNVSLQDIESGMMLAIPS